MGSVDITFEIFTATVSAMTTLSSEVIAIASDESAFNVVLDYAYVGTDLFCANNKLNLGPEDYLDTGACNCVENAEVLPDDGTGIAICGCSDGFDMVTDGETRSCAAGVVLQTATISHSISTTIAWDDDLLDTSTGIGLEQKNLVVSDLVRVHRKAFVSVKIVEFKFVKVSSGARRRRRSTDTTDAEYEAEVTLPEDEDAEEVFDDNLAEQTDEGFPTLNDESFSTADGSEFGYDNNSL